MRVVLLIYTYDLRGWSKVHIYYNLYYAVNSVVNSCTSYQHDVSSKKDTYIYINMMIDTHIHILYSSVSELCEI